MPIRTRKKQTKATTTQRTRKRKTARQVLPQRNRIDTAVKDDYYYLSFIWRNTVDDFDDTVALIKSKGIPFDWSKSPSGCMCFRIKRETWKQYPELAKPKNKKYERKCPAFMPYSCYKDEQLWQMEESNHFPYLYTKWTPVLDQPKRRRRKRG